MSALTLTLPLSRLLGVRRLSRLSFTLRVLAHGGRMRRPPSTCRPLLLDKSPPNLYRADAIAAAARGLGAEVIFVVLTRSPYASWVGA